MPVSAQRASCAAERADATASPGAPVPPAGSVDVYGTPKQLHVAVVLPQSAVFCTRNSQMASLLGGGRDALANFDEISALIAGACACVAMAAASAAASPLRRVLRHRPPRLSTSRAASGGARSLPHQAHSPASCSLSGYNVLRRRVRAQASVL